MVKGRTVRVVLGERFNDKVQTKRSEIFQLGIQVRVWMKNSSGMSFENMAQMTLVIS